MQVNILHSRIAVAEALKLCLHFSNYEDITIYNTPAELVKATGEHHINLIDTHIVLSFLNQQAGDVPFSLLVTSDTDPHIAEALYAGATSFINIAKGPTQFVNQVELIAENKMDEPSNLLRNLLFEKAIPNNRLETNDYNLTKKEMEILKLMRDAQHLKLIASNTDTTYETVRTHVKRIYKKLGVMSASEAVIKAMKMNL
jgi:DNA-binding NarL/FixJ family response regulator